MSTTDKKPHDQVERTDIAIVPVLKFLFWMGVAALVVHGGMWVLFRIYFDAPEPKRDLPPASELTTETTRIPPKPLLQMSPVKELQSERSQEVQETQKGLSDKTTGFTGLPVEQAIEKTAAKGLAAREAVKTPEGKEIGTVMPESSSRGRTYERRQR